MPAPDSERNVVDAPATKKQKGDFIFKYVRNPFSVFVQFCHHLGWTCASRRAQGYRPHVSLARSDPRLLFHSLLSLPARQRPFFTCGCICGVSFVLSPALRSIITDTRPAWHRTDDMLAILFPHLFEDIEFLIAPSDAAVAQQHEPAQGRQTGAARSCANAVAGPSHFA